MRTLSTVALALALTLAVPALTSAPSANAEGCDEEEDKKEEGKNFHVEVRNGQKVYVIDKEITVCGKVPRPSVVYVLQARNIDYQWERLKQDFLPLILNSVKKAPF